MEHHHQEQVHMHHEKQGNLDNAQDFLRRFLIVTGLLIPLLLATLVWKNDYAALAITTVIFGVGWIFFEHAYHEFKSRNFGMMTLVSLAVGSGYLFSIAATFIPTLGMEFFVEISTLIWVLLFGHYLEAKSSSAAGNALDEVAKLLPKQAHVKHGDMIHDMDISTLEEDMIVVIKPGEKVPADGVIVKGKSHFNEAHISGESKPVEKHEAGRVIAGAIAEDGSVEVRLDKVGSNSTIGQIQKLIASAKQTKPSAQRIADKAASILTITAVTVALFTVLIWSVIVGQSIAFSLTLAITVLVIACPHALGLAIPTVSTIATKKAVNHGIFIKDMGKLEVVKNVDYVLFDKTGTLTEGSFGVLGNPDKKVLEIAASLEQSSSHPIAKAILAKQKPLPTNEFMNLAGKGLQGKVNGKMYYVGNEFLMKDKNITVPEIDAVGTVIYVADDSKLLGMIRLSDQIKPEAKKAIDDLHKLTSKITQS